MRKHSPDSSPENSRGGAVMHESPAGVGEQSLSEELTKLDLISEERSSDIDSLSSHDSHSLS